MAEDRNLGSFHSPADACEVVVAGGACGAGFATGAACANTNRWPDENRATKKIASRATQNTDDRQNIKSVPSNSCVQLRQEGHQRELGGLKFTNHRVFR